jgi:hypothetical protein
VVIWRIETQVSFRGCDKTETAYRIIEIERWQTCTILNSQCISPVFSNVAARPLLL